MEYYKVLGSGGVACNGGNGQWHLPHGKCPGEWMPEIKDIEPCERGYHLCRMENILDWLDEEVYEAEGRGKRIECDNKIVFEQARLLRKIDAWSGRTARLFAADCAEHVLHIFEEQYPDDKRPRLAIQTVRAFVAGKINEHDLHAAWAAAWDAARAAAGAAARAAARDAARAAEREWQTKKLFEYLAAEGRKEG